MTPQEPLYPELTTTQDQSLKICNTCFRKLPTTDFEKANHGTSLRGDCKYCRRNKRSVNYKRPTPLASLVSKMCVKCGIEKPVSEFTFVAARIGGLQSYCRDCNNALGRARTLKKADSNRKTLKIEYNSMDISIRPIPKICGNATCLPVR